MFQQMVDDQVDLTCVYAADGQILYVNRAFANFYGCRHRDLVGTMLTLLTPENDRDLAEANLRRVADMRPEDGPARTEFEMIDAQGRQRWVEWVDQPVFDAAGLVTVITATGRDVTERHLVDVQLANAYQRLEETNRDLSDFAYIASHDLQEPLRKIATFTDRLTTNAAEQLDERNLDYLERINGAASRMQRLIDDLLTYSRVGTAGQEFAPCDLAVVVSEVLSDLEISVDTAGATVHVDLLPTVHADPTQMRQLLQNLIGNALKFRDADRLPTIEVRVREDADPSGPEASSVTIEVVDNGIGFEPKHAEKIFAVFQRLHGRSEYDGSGIGLAVCRRIAERHGGSLTALGRPGEGSTFAFSLPGQRSA